MSAAQFAPVRTLGLLFGVFWGFLTECLLILALGGAFVASAIFMATTLVLHKFFHTFFTAETQRAQGKRFSLRLCGGQNFW
jgi:hypothetical protein